MNVIHTIHFVCFKLYFNKLLNLIHNEGIKIRIRVNVEVKVKGCFRQRAEILEAGNIL